MKTLREILNYVAKDYGYENYALLLDSFNEDIIDNYLYDCFIAVQRQQGINDNNLIR